MKEIKLILKPAKERAAIAEGLITGFILGVGFALLISTYL